MKRSKVRRRRDRRIFARTARVSRMNRVRLRRGGNRR